MMEWAWLIPAYGFVAFGVIALVGRYLPGKGAFLSVLAVFAGFVTFWPVLVDLLDAGVPLKFVDYYHFSREWFTAGDITVAWGIIVDPLSVVMLGLVTFVALGIQVYSIGYMRGDPRISWYFAVHSLFAASMLTLVLADNFLLLYVVWELVGFCSYLLIGFWYERRSATEAAKKAFITTRIGDVGLLVGILLLFASTGTFDIGETFSLVAAGEVSRSVVVASTLLIFMGVVGKSAQFPLHVWLPDAMEGPTPVSALIHAATMVVAGVFLLARLFPLYEAVPDVQVAIAGVGLTTALVGGSLALVATDLKRILAYSTISHLGFMVLALGAGGFTAGIFHLVTHGFAKAMLFLCAGAVMHSMNGETDVRKMGGLRSRMPITAAAFTIGALALAGIPPLSGFFSKDEILLAVQENLNPAFLVLFLVAVALSALYMVRALRLVFFGPLSRGNQGVHEAPPVMTGPLVAFGIVTVLVGFIALPLLGDFDGFGSFLFFGKAHDFELSAVWSTVGTLVAVGSFAAGWALYAGPAATVERLRARFSGAHRAAANGFYIDQGYQWLIDNVTLRLAQLTALFDRLVVNDTGVNGTADTVFQAGARIRYHVTGRFYNYGLGMVMGVLLVAVLLWVQPF